jgi:hypothetical protein
MFRTLSKKYLEEFLPKDIPIQKTTHEGLNLKLPLQESGSKNWHELRDIMLESPDSLYQDYYLCQALKYHHHNLELIEHRKRSLEICKKLDRVPIPGSTPSLPSLPSPPPTFKQAERRLEPEAAKKFQPRTPPSIELMDDTSPNSWSSCVEASNVDKSEQKKRKRESYEETPSRSLRSRPAGRIYIGSEPLTVHPVNRTLFKNVAEPKGNRHGSDP